MIEIKNKKDCTGCSACYSICPQNAIKMKEDEEGFKYPVVDEKKCIKCGLCMKICPMQKNEEKNNDFKAYACKNINERERLNSSSGGIFGLIAREILNQNGIVIGATFDKENIVNHISINQIEQLPLLYGSKYVQSNMNDIYKKTKQFLAAGKKVLFTGTPCQIEGLYSFLQHDYENLYTQDLICHGVPSPKVWKMYLEYISKKCGNKIKKIEFRNKDNGWKDFNLKITFEDNSIFEESHNTNIFMKLFLGNVILRDSCYSCKFKKIHRKSDITLADFWGIENVLPRFDDDKGVSAVLINSNKGQEIFNKIKQDLICKEVNINDIIKYNENAIESVNRNRHSKTFFSKFGEKNVDFEKLAKGSTKITLLDKIDNKIYRILKKLKIRSNNGRKK